MASSYTTLEMKFWELGVVTQTPQTSRPKIQMVPEYLRNKNNFEMQYSPKLVSIGPIHHDNQNLKLGENYKFTWARKYILNTHQSPYNLHQKIFDNIHEIVSLFTDEVLDLVKTSKSLEDLSSLEEKLSWLLFVDGCFLLYILMYMNLEQINETKDANNMKVYQIVLVIMDVLLLENQLPYLVLKLLWKNGNEDELIDAMKVFLKCHSWSEIQMNFPDENPPIHLLDLQRSLTLLTTKKLSGGYLKEKGRAISHRNIQDLTAIGINLKSSRELGPRDIDFSEGWFSAKLILPEIVVDYRTSASFLNLIAYEMCPDFENDSGICSFLSFMNWLIDHVEDVRKLKSIGILVNSLGSDQEVVDLFNIITSDLVPNPERYYEVSAKIDEYHRKKCKIWIALGYHTYFSNPWAITGFLAALSALALTSVQTWFSIFPR